MTAARQPSLAAIVPLPADAASALQPLAGEPPLLRIARMLVDALPTPADVVVAAADHLVGDVRAVLESMAAVTLTVVADPASRGRCLAAGLEIVKRRTSSPGFVLIHDVSQPLTSPELRDRVVARLLDGHPVVLPTVPVTDSVKAVDESGSVIATVDRSTLLVVQHPRGFAVDQLAELLGAGDDIDEVHAAMATGAPITVVDGDAEAFTADLPRDMRFVEAVIASRGRR